MNWVKTGASWRTFGMFLAIHTVVFGDDQVPLQIAWKENMLTVSGPRVPGGSVEIWYLEAFCKKDSTHRTWEETVIPHTTRLTAATDDKTSITLESAVGDEVTVAHELRSTHDNIEFELTFTNTSDKAIDIEWAQPCMRVGPFTGLGQDEYISRCFIFTEAGLTMLDSIPRTTEARYKGGQVYVPAGIPREDVNPRPISAAVPVNNLIGCVSADRKWLLAMAWDQTQELFQGIITCIHADLRIGGLEPGETKKVRGVLYVLPLDFDTLLARYQQDFDLR